MRVEWQLYTKTRTKLFFYAGGSIECNHIKIVVRNKGWRRVSRCQHRVRHGGGQVWAQEQWGVGWTWRPLHPGKELHGCTPPHQTGIISLRLLQRHEGKGVHSTQRKRKNFTSGHSNTSCTISMGDQDFYCSFHSFIFFFHKNLQALLGASTFPSCWLAPGFTALVLPDFLEYCMTSWRCSGGCWPSSLRVTCLQQCWFTDTQNDFLVL